MAYNRCRYSCNYMNPLQRSKTLTFGGYMSLHTAAMVEWLCCSTRIYKVLRSNLSIIIDGMTLDKSLTAQLSRMTHSYSTEYIISRPRTVRFQFLSKNVSTVQFLSKDCRDSSLIGTGIELS